MEKSQVKGEAEYVSAYTRENAILDGILIDVTEEAVEAGFKVPVAITRAVYDAYVAVPEKASWQDERGRLWDVLWMTRIAAKIRGKGNSQIPVDLLVQNEPIGPMPVELKAVASPDDHGNMALTIMLPSED